MAPPPRTPPDRPDRRLLAAARGALARFIQSVLGFARRVYDKAGADDIFFLAGGIAFNILLGAIPFLLLLVAIFGYFLEATVADPAAAAVAYVVEVLPASPAVVEFVREMVTEVVGQRGTFGIAGVLLLVWVSTRLIGSLRSALRLVFDVREDRGIVGGKIFDAKMVVVAGTLFMANTAITIGIEAVRTYGVELLGLGEGVVSLMETALAQLLAFAFIFLMFVLIYRFLPARHIPWRIALAAATFTSITFELLKGVFAWWVANFATYSTAYGTLATLIIVVFWIYYSAVVFVLGGVVGQVYELQRIRGRQRELLG